MKHLKKLSVAVMMVTLFSVSFTSCIDNEVSPVVEAIYGAQADLLAAQAAVQNAEAAYLLAQANAENAQAAYTTAQAAQVAAITAGIESENSFQALVREQELLQLVAETNLAVADAENDLALAQVQFEADMAEAIAAMEAAGAQLAVGYAFDYRWAMEAANSILSQKLSAENSLAQAMLLQTGGGVSYAYWLAQLQGNVTTAMADKANLETAIADLQAYMADPTTTEAVISGLKAQNLAFHDAIDAKTIEMQVQFNKIMVIYDEAGVRDEFVLRYEDALAELNSAIAEKQDRLDWIEAAQGGIDLWQLALDDYPAALAAFELAVSDAEAAVVTAQADVDAAQADVDAAVIVQADADADQIAADAALTFLEGELATLYGSLQTAAIDLANEQAIYDAGIGAATTANNTAINNITTAGANLATAQANYTLWKNRFEGLPVINGGYTWEDPGTDPFAPILGVQDPATGVTTASYVRINLWDAGTIAVDDNFAATYELPVVTTLPVGAIVIAYGTILTDSEVAAAYPSIGYTDEYYYRVDADDIAYNNLTELNNAIAALGDVDIFDNPPMLGDFPLGGTDAYTNLWNAQLAQLGTQDTLDNFGDNLAAALLEYEYWRNLYENELVLLDAAQANLAAADLALADANTALADANTALGDANTALADANTALVDANTDLANFLVCDDVCLQGNIDAALANIATWTAEIAAIQPIIDAKQAIVDAMEVEAEGYIASEGVLSGLYADLHAQIIVEWQAYWVLEQERTALQNAHDLNADLISAYGWATDDLGDLAIVLSGLQSDLANANLQIELAEQALASGQVEADAAAAQIAYWQALVDTLEQRHANALAIAAKYKALMDAALAS